MGLAGVWVVALVMAGWLRSRSVCCYWVLEVTVGRVVEVGGEEALQTVLVVCRFFEAERKGFVKGVKILGLEIGIWVKS